MVKEAEAVIYQLNQKLKDNSEVADATKDSLKQALMRVRSVQKSEAKQFNAMVLPNQAEGNPFYQMVEDVRHEEGD